jgi:branched-chain amino acid transport system substrate-binding protein
MSCRVSNVRENMIAYSSAKRTILRLLTLFLALSLSAPATIAADPVIKDASKQRIGVTDNEIVIGSCLPLTGPLKERAEEVAQGANMYFSFVNDQGGVFGRKIKLVVADDKYDPERAIACFNSSLKDKVFAGFLFLGSASIAKYVRMAEATNMPMLAYCTGVSAVYEFHPTQYTIKPSYADEVNAMVDRLCDNAGIKKIAVIYQSDAFGAAIRENVEKSLSYHKLAPVAEASYTRTGEELYDAFGRVKAADPQAVILGATSDKLVGLIQRRHDVHWNALFIAFSVGADYLKEAGNIVDGTVVSQTLPNVDEKLPSIALYAKLRAKYAPSSKMSNSALEGMLNAMIMVEGLKRAGKDLTRDKLIAALDSMQSFDLGLGPNYMVSYSSRNHNGLTSKAVYFNTLKGGKFLPLAAADWKKLKP